MRQPLLFFLKCIVYFLLVFAVWRLSFLLINGVHKPEFNNAEIFQALLHGSRMDLAVISYLLILPLFIWILSQYVPAISFRGIAAGFLAFLIIPVVLINSGNLIIYNFWGSLLNYRALGYLAYPKEVLSSLTGIQLFALLLLLPMVLAAHVYIFIKWIKSFSFNERILRPLHRWISFVLFSGLLIIGMRGGLQMLPMNESLVYFSRNEFLNQAAINPVWHLAYDINAAGISRENPFVHMPEAEAEGIVSEMLSDTATVFPDVLTTRKPNIVLLVLESHTADVVGSFGGEKEVSPHLDQLAKEGLMFSRIYSSGSRTDQGIVSLLNGWPATPYHSIMKSPEKNQHLPSLVKILDDQGYRTSFYYGGESNFANMNSYLLNQGFHSIIKREDFAPGSSSGKWGIHDAAVLSRQLNDLDKTEQPFFSVVMTLSNHEPFDVPGAARFPGKGVEDRFRNAAAYADACVGAYMKEAADKSWYSNTLFIIVADHGHQLPLHRDEIFPNSRHIPFLWYGDVLRPEYRHKQSLRLGGHHDLPSTLLKQIKLPADSFRWSKNLLSPDTKNFMYYQVGQYLGWIEPGEWIAYSYGKNGFAVDSSRVHPPDTLLKRGQAFLQKIYGEYLQY